MKVYVIYHVIDNGKYIKKEVYEVYSSKEKAKKAIDALNDSSEETDEEEWYDIESMEVID